MATRQVMYVQGNTKARSRNHCSRERQRVLCIMSVCVGILAYVIRHANRIFYAPYYSHLYIYMDLQEVGGAVGTGWSWLRIRTDGGHLRLW